MPDTAVEPRPRYYHRAIRPHLWAIYDREAGKPIEYFGAKGRGDKDALAFARERCAELNQETANA